MGCYSFFFGDQALKVGKVGPNSNARYQSQHYTGNAASTLKGSLIHDGGRVGAPGLTDETAGEWIRRNTGRINFLLRADAGFPLLALLESFLQARLNRRSRGSRASGTEVLLGPPRSRAEPRSGGTSA